jgi:RHS repeat-associated protein
MTSGNSTSYYLRDSLGSTVNLTSASGQTQWTYAYEPFGLTRSEQKAPGNQPTNVLKFTGEYLDPSGLYHLRARQYDPQAGRFMTRDPAGQTVNEGVLSAYAYAANRPTVLVDPSGEIFQPSRGGVTFGQFTATLVDWISPDFRCQRQACGGRPPTPPAVSCGARPGHPLGRIGVFLGGLYAGTHTRGNWQSDRAVDIGVPVGTKVCAVFAGRIGPRIGPLDSSDPALAGLRLTVIGSKDEAYYAHLSRIVVRKKESVRTDQLLGYSGTAGVPHLHIALRRGDPRQFCTATRIGARC